MVNKKHTLPTLLMALKGCAPGLWGKQPQATVAELREEWVATGKADATRRGGPHQRARPLTITAC